MGHVSQIIWTVVLLSFGGTGLYFAPRFWWGWAINASSEALWVTYAIVTHDLALLLMASLFWLPMNLRNTRVAYRKEHSHVG